MAIQTIQFNGSDNTALPLNGAHPDAALVDFVLIPPEWQFWAGYHFMHGGLSTLPVVVVFDGRRATQPPPAKNLPWSSLRLPAPPGG